MAKWHTKYKIEQVFPCEEFVLEKSKLLKKTENFAVGIYTEVCIERPLITALALQEDMMIYGNNEELSLTRGQFVVWTWNRSFTDKYLKAWACIIESGIFVYRQQIEITLKYKESFLKYLKRHQSANIQSINVFTLASMKAVETKYPKVSPVIKQQSATFNLELSMFQTRENVKPASYSDLMVVWLLFGQGMLFCMLEFLSECILMFVKF